MDRDIRKATDGHGLDTVRTRHKTQDTTQTRFLDRSKSRDKTAALSPVSLP